MSLCVSPLLFSCTYIILIYLLPYIRIDVYTTMRIYVLLYIRQYVYTVKVYKNDIGIIR